MMVESVKEHLHFLHVLASLSDVKVGKALVRAAPEAAIDSLGEIFLNVLKVSCYFHIFLVSVNIFRKKAKCFLPFCFKKVEIYKTRTTQHNIIEQNNSHSFTFTFIHSSFIHSFRALFR